MAGYIYCFQWHGVRSLEGTVWKINSFEASHVTSAAIRKGGRGQERILPCSYVPENERLQRMKENEARCRIVLDCL